jgi:hypothetical protein
LLHHCSQVLLPELLLVNEFVPLQITITASSYQQPASLQLSQRTAMGATPGQATLLAASPDGKLHVVNPEGQTLQLPAIPAGGRFTQHLWVRSQVPNTCKLVAVLSCPAVVSQSSELRFSEPFDHVTRLNGEVGVHTLVAASHAYAAANNSSSGSNAGQGQGAEEASAAAAAAAAVEGVPLEVGQVVFAQVLVRALHGVDLELLDAQLELQQESGLQVGAGCKRATPHSSYSTALLHPNMLICLFTAGPVVRLSCAVAAPYTCTPQPLR